jgi:hypothetical protein
MLCIMQKDELSPLSIKKTYTTLKKGAPAVLLSKRQETVYENHKIRLVLFGCHTVLERYTY